MRGFIKYIWNGPFYIGQITRPVSIGDVLMKLLETAWRALIIAAVAFSIIGTSLSLWDAYTYTKRGDDKAQESGEWDEFPLVDGLGNNVAQQDEEWPGTPVN
ncbi:hypothetical protein GCM10007897_36050 [Sphingobium jiangsuense]|nr:hypothetical protein GCM10007897_36050 [Sphingobium jiangsuense]